MPDDTKFVLGPLCKRGHDHEGTGQSLRHLRWRRGKHERGDCCVCRKSDRKRRYAADPESAKNAAKAWYAQNRERAGERTKAHYQEHRQEILEYQRDYRIKHPAKIQASKAEWYCRNAKRVRAKSRRWYWANPRVARAARRRWRLTNLDAVRAKGREYSASPRGKETARRASAKYRMLKASQSGIVTVSYKEALLEALRGCCPRCGVVLTTTSRLSPTSLTWDHVIPLSRGGKDEDGNLIPLCHSCNTSKGNRTVAEWLQRPVLTLAEMRRHGQ